MKKAGKEKSVFPKINKKIKDFISNEDGNLSTKAALAVGGVGLVTLGVSEVLGQCTISNGHFNGTTNGHYNGTGTFGATANASGICILRNNNSYFYDSSCTPLECSSISGVVNGHYNITPTCTTSAVSSHCNHISSGSGSGSGSGGDDSGGSGGDDGCDSGGGSGDGCGCH